MFKASFRNIPVKSSENSQVKQSMDTPLLWFIVIKDMKSLPLLPIERKRVILRLDFGGFALGKPHAKLPKPHNVMKVALLFLLISNTVGILYVCVTMMVNNKTC